MDNEIIAMVSFAFVLCLWAVVHDYRTEMSQIEERLERNEWLLERIIQGDDCEIVYIKDGEGNTLKGLCCDPHTRTDDRHATYRRCLFEDGVYVPFDRAPYDRGYCDTHWVK